MKWVMSEIILNQYIQMCYSLSQRCACHNSSVICSLNSDKICDSRGSVRIDVVFWVVPYSLVRKKKRFRRTCYLRLQG
jgi:hypothetical protein